jgi:hypothetical protein
MEAGPSRAGFSCRPSPEQAPRLHLPHRLVQATRHSDGRASGFQAGMAGCLCGRQPAAVGLQFQAIRLAIADDDQIRHARHDAKTGEDGRLDPRSGAAIRNVERERPGHETGLNVLPQRAMDGLLAHDVIGYRATCGRRSRIIYSTSYTTLFSMWLVSTNGLSKPLRLIVEAASGGSTRSTIDCVSCPAIAAPACYSVTRAS